MEVSFATTRLSRVFNSQSALAQTYGARRAEAIINRVTALRRFLTLSQVPTAPPFRRHQLIGNRDEQYAVNIDAQFRILFVPDHAPIPRRSDGGIDTDRVTAITITEITDYH